MSVYPSPRSGVAFSDSPAVVGTRRRGDRSILADACTRRPGARIAGYLIAAIALLSMGDLAMTLIVVTQLGMIEMNPFARAVMHHGSPEVLAVWKLATVGLACWILYRARGRTIGQIGAWIGFLVLVALTVYWSLYIDELAAFACKTEWIEGGYDDRWVMMVRQS